MIHQRYIVTFLVLKITLFDEETGLRIPFTLERTLSVFKSRSLTNEEINNVEDFETIFLTLE